MYLITINWNIAFFLLKIDLFSGRPYFQLWKTNLWSLWDKGITKLKCLDEDCIDRKLMRANRQMSLPAIRASWRNYICYFFRTSTTLVWIEHCRHTYVTTMWECIMSFGFDDFDLSYQNKYHSSLDSNSWSKEKLWNFSQVYHTIRHGKAYK